MVTSRGQVVARRHVMSVVVPVLVYGGMFVISLFAFLYLFGAARDRNLEIQIACQFAAMIFGALVIWEYVQWRNYFVIVGNPRMIERRGWLFRRERVWDLTGASIVLAQDPVDRFFDRGDVYLYPGNGSTVHLSDLAPFAQVRRRLER